VKKIIKLSLLVALTTTIVVGCGSNVARDKVSKNSGIINQNPNTGGEISQDPKPFQPINEPTPRSPILYNGDNN